MISSLAQYKHLSPYALQYVAVKGNPYCLRFRNDKNLPPVLSEDEAYIKEAFSERLYWIAEAGRRSLFKTDKTRDLPEINGDRILRIEPKADGLLDRLSKLVKDQSYIDIDEYEKTTPPKIVLEALNVPAEDLTDPNGFSKEQDDLGFQIENEINDRDEFIISVEHTRDEDISKCEIDRKGQIEEIDDLLNTKKQQYQNTRDNEKKNANDKMTKELAKEETRYEDEIEAINGKEDIEEWEKHELTKKESNTHLLNTLAIENDYVASIRKSEDDYLIKCGNAEETAKEKKKEINDIFDGRISDIKATAENTIEERMARSYETLKTLFGKISPFAEYYITLLHQKISKEWDEYIDKVEKCRITKLLTSKWFSRNLLYTYASTPLDRTYADLERMRAPIIPYDVEWLGTSGGDPDKLTVIRVPPVKFTPSGSTFDPFLSKSHPLLHHEFGFATGYSIESHEYHYYYGRRYEVDKIEAIYVDVIVGQMGEDYADEERDELISDLRKQVSSKINTCLEDGRAEGKWQFKEAIPCHKSTFEVIESSELDESEKNTLNRTIQQQQQAFQEKALEYEKEYVKHRSVQLRAERLTFLPLDKPNEGYYERIDKIEDSLQKDVFDLEEEYNKIISDLTTTRDNELHQIEKTYKAQVAAANDTYDKAILDANGIMVDSVQETLKNANTIINKCLSDGDEIPLEVYLQVYDALIDAEAEFKGAKAKAEAAKEEAIAAADGEREKAISEVEEQYSEDKEQETSIYYGPSGKITARRKNAQDEIDEVYKSRDDEIKNLNDAFKLSVDEYKSTLQKMMDNLNKEYLDEISKDMSNYTYKYEDRGKIKYIVFEPTKEATEDEKTKIKSLNNRSYNNAKSLSSKYSQFYSRQEEQLVRDKYEIPPLMPFARQRFSCPALEPSERLLTPPEIEGRDFLDELQIVYRILNVVVKAKPRTLTNMSLDNYKDEIAELMGKKVAKRVDQIGNS